MSARRFAGCSDRCRRDGRDRREGRKRGGERSPQYICSLCSHFSPASPASAANQKPRTCVMDDYALVLNAGSSSLKFCVFQRPNGERWRLEARGQIEGIGTSPRLSVKGADGAKLADEELTASVRDGRDAIDAS